MNPRRIEVDLASRDGTRLRAVGWHPEPGRDNRRVVVLVHGLAEHMGRYDHVAAALCGAGWRVLGVELRGHGQSEGKRGHVMAWSEYRQDVAAAMAHAEGPCYLLGHSMGGLVVLDLLREHTRRGEAADIGAVVLSNPCLGLAVRPPGWKKALSGLVSSIAPATSFGNEIDPNLISRDPEVVAAYVADPAVFSTVTARWYTEMVAAMARVHAQCDHLRTPVLLLTSDHDRLCDPAAARAWAARCPDAVQERRYPELFHELLNEPEKDRILTEVMVWLGERLR